MPQTRSGLKHPAMTFTISLAASALAFIFIGFPGICGFTGRYGDEIARSTFGFWLALGLLILPLLGIIASIIWWFSKLFPGTAKKA